MIDLEKLREKMEGKHEAGVELIGVPPLQIVELIDLIASFEKDAARYRLRLETIRALYPNAPSDCELDIAIGAALQSQEAAMGNPIAQQNQQVASPVVLPEPRWHNPSPHNAAHFPYYTPDDVRALLAQANAAGAQAVPDFCHVASLKLKSLQERGYQLEKLQ